MGRSLFVLLFCFVFVCLLLKRFSSCLGTFCLYLCRDWLVNLTEFEKGLHNYVRRKFKKNINLKQE